MIQKKAIKKTKKASIMLLDKKIQTNFIKFMNKANSKYLPTKLLTISQGK